MRFPLRWVVVIALLAGGGGSAAHLPPPTAQSATTSRSPLGLLTGAPSVDVVDMSFVDRLHGWVLTSECTQSAPATCTVGLLRTRDGGLTYQGMARPGVEPTFGQQSDGRPAHGVSKVLFADTLNGWLYGPSLRTTHDGGEHWSVVALNGSVIGMAAVGSSVWALTTRCTGAPTDTCTLGILSSTAGGGGWASMPSGSQLIRSGAFPPPQLVRSSARRAWLVFDHLVATSDGGRGWQEEPRPCEMSLIPGVLAAADDDNLSVACGAEPGAGNQGKEIFASTDGGRSWVLKASVAYGDQPRSYGSLPGFGYLGDLVATSPGRLWLALGRSTLFASSDNGHTWQTAIDDPSVDADGGPVRLRFVDLLHGWVAFLTRIYRTSDGGAHWMEIPLVPSL